MIGGVERFIEAQIDSLGTLGLDISIFFEDFVETRMMHIPLAVEVLTKNEVLEGSFDNIVIHKFEDIELVDRLSCSSKAIVVVHDHEFYCKRGHKFFPNNTNCNQPFNSTLCSVCSGFGLKKKEDFPYLKFEKDNTAEKLGTIKKIDRFVVISNHMKENLILNGIDGSVISIARPFVPRQAEIASLPRETQGLYVGQLIKGKGILKFSRKYQGRRWKLSIVGTGKDMANLKKLNEKDRNIEILGFQNPAGFYKESNFVVFTSTWSEPFGLVGIEAMSFGLPVVAFNVGGVSDWLKHGENGFLVDLGDYESFFYFCDKLSSDEKLAKKLGINAKNFVMENFAFENYISDWENILGCK